MGKYLDLAKCAIEEAHGQPEGCDRPELKAVGGLSPREPGARRERLLAAINGLVDPSGLFGWLWSERPDLIFLGQELVAAIDRAINHPDFRPFEQVLVRLLAHYHECCRLFEARDRNRINRFLENTPTPDKAELDGNPYSQARERWEQQQVEPSYLPNLREQFRMASAQRSPQNE